MQDRISNAPGYREQVEDITADKRGRVILASTLRRLQPLLLDAVQPEMPLRVNGDYLYADPDSTGKIYVKLNSGAEDAFPLTAQAAVEGIPIKDILVSWAAQPGMVMNLWYGYQARFKPPQSNIGTIGSILSPVSLNPEDARYFLFGDDETMDDEGFVAGSLGGPTGVQVTVHQLWNPVASGKVLYVHRMCSMFSTAASRHIVYRQVAAGGALIQNGQNLNLGGAAGAGEYRVSNGALGGMLMHQFNNSNTFLPLDFKAPIRIAPGNGVSLEDTVVNQATIGMFCWREKLT